MPQIRVEQIADLGIVTDENGVKHIVIGSDTIIIVYLLDFEPIPNQIFVLRNRPIS